MCKYVHHIIPPQPFLTLTLRVTRGWWQVWMHVPREEPYILTPPPPPPPGKNCSNLKKDATGAKQAKEIFLFRTNNPQAGWGYRWGGGGGG